MLTFIYSTSLTNLLPKIAPKIWYITFYTNMQKLPHLLSPFIHFHQTCVRCTSMTKDFIYKNKKISGLHSNITWISKCISKIYKSFSTTSSCVMYPFFILLFMFLVFIVARCMHQQVTANQKSIQLLLFTKYTHCYLYSTKGRLNHGLQSFETWI